ncbi:hypothetical protein EIN_394270 [Entamoeba invadens IP1]|uniref:VWFA domain-containing protein n=1 Tax=Entamoeba invadens IP1 TaxID=370355 RepID=L7FM44_ENTIV|nr:hypothetical protein EIN_394270 [Entamoeba invadens IP1]ELP90240.1 hypothetical protein EIN_394270 [Entamoeba invadens IP1]|eukprot:XP_004257011.1 hypothetical protein EIN_394270 [Entamoeba invadens IP1]
MSDEKVGPVDVIFICDRSGSMCGKGIESLKSALQLFLRQLPTDSTFDIISFGSQFDSLFSGLKKYDETSFDFASKAVENFESNYGGTNILEPLKSAMAQKSQIILLTDGQVRQNKKIEILKYLEDNRGKAIVHCIGLGNGVDSDLIKDIGNVGGGISVVVRDTKNLRRELSKITNKVLLPAIKNGKVTLTTGVFEDGKSEEVVGIFNKETFAFFDTTSDSKVEGTLTGNVGEKKVTLTSTEKVRIKDTILGQFKAFEKLKVLESKEEKEKCVKLSLKYNVLSKYTTFVAIDKSTKVETDSVKQVDISQIEHNQSKPTIIRGAYEFVPPTRSSRYKPERERGKKDVDDTDKNEYKYNQLINKQKFDGRFENVISIFDEFEPIQKKFVNEKVDTQCVTTAIAIVILRKYYADREVEWALLEEKAMKYLAQFGYGEELVNKIIEETKS